MEGNFEYTVNLYGKIILDRIIRLMPRASVKGEMLSFHLVADTFKEYSSTIDTEHSDIHAVVTQKTLKHYLGVQQ